MTKTVPFLLEGTCSMYSLTVNESSPRVTVVMHDNEAGDGASETKILDMPTFLSALSGTLLSLSRVINCPNGGISQGGGWPLDVCVTGWLSKTCVSAALDSSPGTHLGFYHRIMYMGWPCTTTGQGCMPVQESHAEGILAGCHPFDLTNMDLRGVDASIPPETLRVMADLMEESVQPQASPELLRTIGNHWLPCRALEQINAEATRKQGVTYNRVVAMESPCAPEYLAIIHEAKRRLVDETNKINLALPDGDEIKLYSLLEGLSDLVCADVPNCEIKKLTVVDSMKQAMKNIGWPRKLAHGG